MSISGTEIKIKKAIKTDPEKLAVLAGDIFYETFKGTMPDQDLDLYIKEAFNISQISREIEDERNTFLLAYFGDLLVGYAKLNTSRPLEALTGQKVIELERLYVLKRYHGNKIGSLLMRYAINLALEKYNVIWLAVWEKNSDAIAIYQKWGFEIFGSQIFMRGNDPQTGLLMRKNLI